MGLVTINYVVWELRWHTHWQSLDLGYGILTFNPTAARQEKVHGPSGLLSICKCTGRSGHGCFGVGHSLDICETAGRMLGAPPSVSNLEEEEIMEPFKITRPGQPYEGPQIGSRLAKKLGAHRC